MRFMSNNWSATKQHLHPQSVAEISPHSVLGHRLGLATRTQISVCQSPFPSALCRHRSVPVPCENGSAKTTDAEGGQNLIVGLWVHTLGEN